MKEKIISYVPTKKVNLDELLDENKAKELIKKIECSNIKDEEKIFLSKAATRFIQFKYNNIAEYYANASKEMQELMEESGLVIIDINNALQNGFVKLYDEIEKQMEK